MKYISVAVDGPSGAGKSTISKALAQKFGLTYVDTGAIYRAVAYYVIANGISPDDAENVEKLLPGLQIDINHTDGQQYVFVNGTNVSGLIRTEEISKGASDVSAIPAVREYLLETQRDFAKRQSVILDGRDIGTVVLPNADIKIYLTATPEERAKRRYKEQAERGMSVTYEEVLENIIQRDYNDTHRDIAPLKQADDAVYIDNTYIDFEQTLAVLSGFLEKEIQRCSQ